MRLIEINIADEFVDLLRRHVDAIEVLARVADTQKCEVPTAQSAPSDSSTAPAPELTPVLVDAMKKVDAALDVTAATPDDTTLPMKERIRHIIDFTRKRVHGDDVEKYRRMFNQRMVQIAGIVGFAKPTEINTERALDEFAHRCGILAFDGDKYNDEVPF